MINEGHLKGSPFVVSSWVVTNKVDLSNSKRVGGVIKTMFMETSPRRTNLLAHLVVSMVSTFMVGG